VSFSEDTGAAKFSAERAFTENKFFITQGKEPYAAIDVPFITNGFVSALDLLKDSLGKAITLTTTTLSPKRMIRSQPADSLFRPMMHRSDNFFAEQTLLMASNVKLGVMSDSRMIDHILHNDLKDLPQKPRWADGSGLSRYNLFTPRDFVWILQKMKNEFGIERIKNILPTGGTGTLANYYRKDSTYIYAKTGSLSGVICISGYLYGKTGRLMIFSVLVNNDRQPAWTIRRKVEAFLEKVRTLN
jgi:D-alanyl-D-alanine carboxypeptidase/D-alanyl-D-alanine-endopeptidase (penicillin-binding protein 4)